MRSSQQFEEMTYTLGRCEASKHAAQGQGIVNAADMFALENNFSERRNCATDKLRMSVTVTTKDT